jgi:hypothetical protein
MPTTKSVKAPENAGQIERFSLVPAASQRQMYKALEALKPSTPDTASGIEVAEIALRLAIGVKDPVMLAYPAPGPRPVSKTAKAVQVESSAVNGGRLAAATLSAIAALLSDATATALVCAGKLDPQEDYRRVFSFAARHKLSILFLVANTLTPGRRQTLDLRTLPAEFGIPVFSVAANDAIAAYRVATEALHNARHLRGPCVIEALTVTGKHQSAIGALDLLRNYMERHGNWPL